MCLVETGARNAETGQVVMLPKLVPACQTPARDGTVFVTDSEKVRHSRAFVEEGLLIDHPIDCPICDKAGECLLQDYHFEHGQSRRRADIRPFTSRRHDIGPTVTLFTDRCVMCSRCVRFTREITGTAELMVAGRGSHEEIDVLPGFPLDNRLSGNVVDLCPVGALGDKDFLYRQRVWFMNRHAGVCAGCSTGCSIWIEENQHTVHRLKPRDNPHVNQWWMCDEGRYGYHHVHDARRLTGAARRGEDGYVNMEWSAVAAELDEKLRSAGALAAVLSPHLTVEEAYMLAQYVREIDASAALVLGPIPVQGEDETFPNGFTIHAEKCPNRRGVEQVIRHFADDLTTFNEWIEEFEADQYGAVWVTGGYKTDGFDQAAADRLSAAPVLVVQDMFASPLWEAAAYRLPGAAFAEREGSYVNHAGRLQSFRWAVRPPAGVWTEGQLYWRLLKKPGMVRAADVLQEMAACVPSFAPAADDVPPTGVKIELESAEQRTPQTTA
jgi:NADH-quinone oxidoreductase subunit G